MTVQDPVAPPVAYETPPAATSTRHPVAIWFFFWGEFAERCSYYGMRAILPLYLTSLMKFPDTTAGPIFYWFKMACYFLPLLGGYLADRFFGKYWTIVGFSVPYVLGHFVLGIQNHTALFIALALLAGGSGVIKPNISTLMGLTYDQKRPGQEQLRSAAFMLFYLSINVGSLISVFALPIVRDRWGYRMAFQFPAWLMVAALLVFAAGKPHYAVETPARLQAAEPLSPEERKRRWRTMGQLFAAFGLFVFFWVGYEHNDSLWVFFARDYVNLQLPGLSRPIAPEQPQSLNPLFVVICVPLFAWSFKRLDPEARVITPVRKIFAGFMLTALSIAVMAAAGYLVRGGGKVSVAWLAAAYILLTLGEILLYGTGLELAYAAAPKDMKGFVTACFLLTNTLGNFVNVWLSPLYGGSLTDPPEKRGPLAPGPFFGITALIVLVAGIAFILTSRRLDTQSRSAAAAAA